MSEKYISASKLKAHYSWLGKDATLSPKDVDDIVDAQPAADVEPVVRGEWMEEECFVCSRCGMPATWAKPSLRKQLKTDYCSSCGAHMERSGSGDK